MAQFYTLEEAARVLGMAPEELRGKAQAREVRAFMDGGSWRFRSADIDELARRRGLGSDPDLSLSDLDLSPPDSTSGEVDLSEFQLGVAEADLGPPSVTSQATTAGTGDLLLDDLSVPPGPLSASSSTIIGMEPAGKSPSDSDVRLVPDNVKGASDSDVKLAGKAPSDSDVTLAGLSDSGLRPTGPSSSSHDFLPTPDSGVIELPSDEVPPGGPGDTAIRQGPQLGSSAEVQAVEPDSGSDFELTPSSVIDALQPDSGSDFELTALDASDDYEVTPKPTPSDSDVTAAEPSASGINLGRPSDSGVDLTSALGGGVGGGLSSIELAPLEGEDAGPKPPQVAKPASPGATPPPARTPVPSGRAEKDIFEDTDFEVDALDSGHEDRTVQLERGSDYDLAESDSGSEVYAVDEEDVDTSAATALRPAPLDEDEGFAAEGPSGETPSAWDVESEGAPAAAPAARAAAGAEAAPALLPGAAGQEWGVAWVSILGVTTFLMFLMFLVTLDLLGNLYDYHGRVPVAGSLASAISGLAGGK
jgi:excisionase family DNA binding protein